MPDSGAPTHPRRWRGPVASSRRARRMAVFIMLMFLDDYDAHSEHGHTTHRSLQRSHRGGAGGGQAEDRRRPLTGRALDDQLAVVQLHDPAREREAESGAARRA